MNIFLYKQPNINLDPKSCQDFVTNEKFDPTCFRERTLSVKSCLFFGMRAEIACIMVACIKKCVPQTIFKSSQNQCILLTISKNGKKRLRNKIQKH